MVFIGNGLAFLGYKTSSFAATLKFRRTKMDLKALKELFLHLNLK